MFSVEWQPAYVLHTRRFAESGLLVDFITRDQGRMTLLAKGALNSKSGRQALLQPFMPLAIAWRGRGETPVLTRIEAAGQAHRLKGKPLYCGLYLNELLLYLLLRPEPQPALFVHYVASLLALLEGDDGNACLEPVLRRFERQLLHELGVGLNLTHDHLGNALEPTAWYQYRIQEGPRLCDAGHPAGIQGDALLALANDAIVSEQQRKQTRNLMRCVLNYYLQGKPLKSRDLFTHFA